MKLKSVCTALGAILMLAIGQPAFAQTPDGGGAMVRFQIFQATGDMLFRVMQDKFCAKYDIRCKGIRVGAGPAGIQALLGNSLQVSYITTDAAIREITGGAPVKIIQALGNRVPFYLVANSKLAQEAKGQSYPAVMKLFKGKRIGVTGRGAGTELIARLLLHDAGISANDVTFVAVGGPPTAYGSFASGQIDAAVEVPPLAEICKFSKVCGPVLNLPAEQNKIPSIKKLAGTGIVALMSDSYIKKNRQVVLAWLAAAKDASAWIHNPANSDELYSIAKKYIPLHIAHSDKILRLALKRWRAVFDIHVNPRAVEAYVDMLDGMGLVPRKLGVDQFVSEVAPLAKK